jgi:hypothetical protein
MNRTPYRTLIALLWLAPVAIAFRYWQVWDRLPVRMAAHFDAAGRANGWMTREISLLYSVVFLTVMVFIFSVVLYAVQTKCELSKLLWALLAFFQVEIWTMTYMLDSLVSYNLYGKPIAVAPLSLVTGIGLLAILAVAFSEKRGPAFSGAEVLAEETHSGKLWGALFLLPAVAMAVIAMAIPGAVAKMTIAGIGLVSLAAFVMAWDGFHYFFTRHGVEIRTLGFRLKSIPALQIKTYEIQSWNPWQGLGIRGVGNHKAYVWGKTGVRVEMYDGDVFLGHSDPQRILHDLNIIKRYQSS